MASFDFGMNHDLISFPSSAMNHITAEDFPSVVESSHAAIREAKTAGVCVFGGGIDETVAPVMVTGEGKVSPGTYPEASSKIPATQPTPMQKPSQQERSNS